MYNYKPEYTTNRDTVANDRAHTKQLRASYFRVGIAFGGMGGFGGIFRGGKRGAL